MTEEFKSEKEYKDGDIITVNGKEYVIKAVEKEKKSLEEQVSVLENRINSIDKILKIQAGINVSINKKIGMVNDSLWSTNHITGGVPPFYI